MAQRGKPPIDIQAELRVFEIAVAEGMGITKALEKANIKRTTYYEYLADNPDYANKIRRLKSSLVDIAENALSTQLEATPTTDAHRKEIADLAKWVISNRRQQADQIQPTLPMGVQPIQININGKEKGLTAQDLKDLTDEELALIQSEQKTYAEVIADRENGGDKKPKKAQ